RSVDGFVIASSEISNQTINESLRAKKIPFNVLDQKKAEGFSDAVLTDDYRGRQLAAKHLQEQRHEQVVVVMPPQAPDNIQQRLKGFCSVYTE
ncbi:LacI family transcriptional regulator, partial [Enterococcus faecalis]